MLGDTFHPWPSSRAETAPVPSAAIPPLPLLPSKFSALIDRVCAPDSSDKFPSDIPSPLNVVSIVNESLNPRGLDRLDQLALEHEEQNERRRRHDIVPGRRILALETRNRQLHKPEILSHGTTHVAPAPANRCLSR